MLSRFGMMNFACSIELQDVLQKQRIELGTQIRERNVQIEQCIKETDDLQGALKDSTKQIV